MPSDFADEQAPAHEKPPIPEQGAEAATPAAAASKPPGAAASKPADTVLTTWMLNYSSVLGRRKDPSRTDADQLIVDELRVQPNVGKSVLMHGGNAARVGRVHLGDASVAKGPGSVAALVRYGQRAGFKVKLSLDSKPSRDERHTLNKLAALARRRALEEAATEGDYKAIASTLEQELAPEFDGKQLRVEIVPDRVKGGIAAHEGAYQLDQPSRFEIDIEPDDINKNTHTEAGGGSSEESESQSHSEGNKLTSESTTQAKQSQAEELETRFVSTLNQRVSQAFKEIEQEIVTQADDHAHTHKRQISWKAGIGPAQADDKTKAAAGPGGSGDGALKNAWKALSGGSRWVLRSVKDNVVKRIPLFNAGLALAGSLWDSISGRASIERDSVETEGDTDTRSTTHSTTRGTEVQDLSEIAHTLSTQIVTTHKQELETLIASRFGTELSVGDRHEHTKKKTVNDAHTETSTVYEARIPRITIKKLG